MKSTSDRELLELESNYWRAIRDKDGASAARMTDESCILTGPGGIRSIDRSGLQALMTNGSTDVRDFALGAHPEVRFITDDVAVVAYDVHEDLIVDGHPATLDAADTSTWVRRNGEWMCALHTESVKGNPFVAGRHDEHHAKGRYHELMSELGEIMKAFPRLPFGSAVSPAMPDPVDENSRPSPESPRQVRR